jgi:hypothetical protein
VRRKEVHSEGAVIFGRALLDSVTDLAAAGGGEVAAEVERLGAGWTEATAAAEAEVLAWRRGHAQPTLTELEEVTAVVARRLQRRLLEELAPTAAPGTRPDCPRCRTPMERRGRKVREVLIAHQPEPVRLERAYYGCPACGAGLFPPG